MCKAAGLWTYPQATVDLRGFSVCSSDGAVGKGADATYGDGTSYLVVDTRPWIIGKKVIVPAGVVGRVDEVADTVMATITKGEIKAGPAWRPHEVDSQAYRRRVEGYYARLLSSPPGRHGKRR